MSVKQAFNAVFRRRQRQAVAPIYAQAVERARNPAFYADFGVPDTVDGRFEMVALHVHLLCRRLIAEGDWGETHAQALFDLMFADMDRNLREMGTGDLVVGKRIKRMAQDYYGRAGAVEEGLQDLDPKTLVDAVQRNLLAAGQAEGDAAPDEVLSGATAIAAYIRRVADHLAALSGDRLRDARSGDALFGPVRVG